MKNRAQITSQRYDIIREVSKTNLGTTHKALDRKFNRFVTVISIHSSLLTESETIISLDERVSRFLTLDHENIACVFDCEKGKGAFLLVEEWIDGPNLRQVLFRLHDLGKVMPHQLACFLGWRLCKAVDYAHNKKTSLSGESMGIVHGDIQPSNVMVSSKGEIKLTDFGIMQSIVEHQRETAVTNLSYKTAYLSPEIVNEELPVHQSDLFSLGVVLWECLTGKSPFAGHTHLETLRNIMLGAYDSKPLKNSNLPEELKQLLKKAVDVDKENRYQVAEEMAGDIRSVLGGQKESDLSLQLGEWVSALFADELDKQKDWSIISADLSKQMSRPHVRSETTDTEPTTVSSPKSDRTEVLPAQEVKPTNDTVVLESTVKPIEKRSARRTFTWQRARAMVYVSLSVAIAAAVFALFYQRSRPRDKSPQKPLSSVPGHLTLSCAPESCEVRVCQQGKEAPVFSGLSSRDTLRLAPATYLISISKPGYNAVKESIAVRSDSVTRRTVDLTPALHKVTVTANRAGATVFIDGNSKGNAPVTEALQFGKHRIKVAWKGRSQRRNLMLGAGQTDTTIAVAFHEKKEHGQLKITGRTWADVWVDGKKLSAQAPCNIQLTTGKHVIKLSNPVTGTVKKTVTIEQGKTTTIRI
jgi:serine/threonine protein kinase